MRVAWDAEDLFRRSRAAAEAGCPKAWSEVQPVASVLSLFGSLEIVFCGGGRQATRVAECVSALRLEPFVTCIRNVAGWSEVGDVHMVIGRDPSGRCSAGPAEPVPSPEEPWDALVERMLAVCCRRRILAVPGEGGSVVSCRRVSQRGASAAFHLATSEGREFKLRVFESAEAAHRVGWFLSVCAAANDPHTTRLVAANGTAVLKRWLPGADLVSLPAARRLKTIHLIGRGLARLHSISPERWRSYPPALLGDAADPRPLICGADNFNTVVTPGGQVAFVDLEACAAGAQWVDLAWSEALLCESVPERDTLLHGYVSVAGEILPEPGEWRAARRTAVEWLEAQLCKSARCHPNDADVLRDLETVRRCASDPGRWLDSPAGLVGLFRYG